MTKQIDDPYELYKLYVKREIDLATFSRNFRYLKDKDKTVVLFLMSTFLMEKEAAKEEFLTELKEAWG